MTDWCILRTCGGKTLPLARSLAEAGFEVWTPEVGVVRRFGRKRDRQERPAPLVPTFVFARADRLHDLIATRLDLRSKHPAFSVFHHLSRPVLVADRELGRLREVEERYRQQAARRAAADARGKAEPYATGAVLPFDKGAWTGLTAKVEQSDKRTTWLCFGGSLRLKIETSILRQDGIAPAPSAA